jgi:hypothetical protein
MSSSMIRLDYPESRSKKKSEWVYETLECGSPEEIRTPVVGSKARATILYNTFVYEDINTLLGYQIKY